MQLPCYTKPKLGREGRDPLNTHMCKGLRERGGGKGQVRGGGVKL